MLKFFKYKIRFILIICFAVAFKSFSQSDSVHPIFRAIVDSNYTEVKKIIETGIDVNQEDSLGNTALILFAEQGKLELIKLLLEKGAHIDHQNNELRTALYQAVKFEEIEVAQYLLEQGADIELKQYNGYTPLSSAAFLGNIKLLELLLKYNAEINTQQIDGYSALHFAARDGYLDIVIALLDKGAIIELEDKRGRTPLIWAAKEGHLEIVKKLLNHGAYIEHPDNWSYTPLMRACENGHLETVNLLLEWGANIEHQDQWEYTPLNRASQEGHYDVVLELIKQGANIEHKDYWGFSPLHRAVQKGHADIVELLINNGASLNTRNKWGSTPLNSATFSENFEIALILLQNNANINIRDKYGDTPLNDALDKGFIDFVDFLIDHGADLNLALSKAMTEIGGKPEIVKLLLERGADINTQDENGATPLMWAIYLNSFEMVKYLVENGADCSLKGIIHRYDNGYVSTGFEDHRGSLVGTAASRGRLDILKYLVDECGISINDWKLNSNAEPDTCIGASIFYAVRYNYIDIIDYFLTHKDSLHTINDDGFHLLHYAAGYGNKYIANKLLQDDIENINIQANNGRTPLMHAIEYGRLEMVHLFYYYGADLHIIDTTGLTAVDIAIEKDYTPVINFLKKPVLHAIDLYNIDLRDTVLNLIKQSKININVLDKDGQSLFHKAIFKNDTSILGLLIEKKYNLNITDSNGWTSLFYSLFIGNTKIAEKLILGGADINIPNNDSITPISIARNHSYEELCQMLEGLDAKSSNLKTSVETVLPTQLSGIYGIAISPDGKYILNSSEGTLTYRDFKTGKHIKSIDCPSARRINSITFSPDGNYILLVHYFGTLELKEFYSGKTIRVFIGHTEPVDVACFSKNGKYILSGSRDNSMKLWDIKSGECIKTIFADNSSIDWRKTDFGINTVDISINGNLAISASADASINLWDLKTGKKIKSFYGHSELVSSACFTPDIKFIVSGSHDNTIKLWDINTGEQLYSLSGHKSDVDIVRFSQDGETIASASYDKTIKLWDTETGREIFTLEGHTQSIVSICFTPDQKFLLSSQKTGNFKIWDISTGKEVKTIQNKPIGVYTSDLAKSNSFFISGLDNSVRLFDFASLKCKTLYKHKSYNFDNNKYEDVFTVKLLHNDNYVLSGSSDKTIKLWDIENDKLIKEFIGHQEDIRTNDISPDEQYFVSGAGDYEYSKDNSIKLWDQNTGELLHTFNTHTQPISSVCFAPDGKSFISASADSTIKLWDTETYNEIFRCKGHTDLVYKAIYLNKDTILSGSYDNTFKLWNAKTGEELKSYDNKNSPLCFDVSPDGQYCAYGNRASFFEIFDLKSNETIQIFIGHKNWVEDIKFSNDNRYILSASGDQTSKVWDQKTKQLIATIIFMEKDNWILFTPDHFYAGTKDAGKEISFRKGDLELFGFEQFDLKYNRPDIILARLGYSSQELIDAYYKAYQKRLKKMGFKESDLGDDFHMPESAIKNFEYLPLITDTAEINLDLNFQDSKYKLDRYNIWINDVAVYGFNGIDLRSKQTSLFDAKVSLPLSQGKNKIQVSCLNEKGVESLKETVEIRYESKKSQKPDLYFIAISTSKYQQSEFDLKYAVKDGRDLAQQFSKSINQYENIFIDTLFNKNATLESVTKLKEKLLQTNVDDQVILFISGHGLLDDKLDFYFATYDMDFNNPAKNGLSYDLLESLLDSIPARKKLFMMDACHSGEVDKDDLIALNETNTNEGVKSGVKSYTYRAMVLQQDETKSIGLQNSFELMQEYFANLNRGSGAVVISAAAGNSYAMESDIWNNGVFTYSVLNGLQSDAADLNNDNQVSVSELREYVIDNVQDLTGGKQKPTSRQENVEFDFRVW